MRFEPCRPVKGPWRDHRCDKPAGHADAHYCEACGAEYPNQEQR